MKFLESEKQKLKVRAAGLAAHTGKKKKNDRKLVRKFRNSRPAKKGEQTRSIRLRSWSINDSCCEAEEPEV